jgi:hypothetical protein
VDEFSLSVVDAGAGFSRRQFLGGALGLGLIAGIGALAGQYWFDNGVAYADGPTVPLPGSGTAPEQVHLAWGGDPETSMTVSWLAPGTVPQPAPSLRYAPASGGEAPGAVPPSSSWVSARSFTDGANAETFHTYHARLTGLRPGTTYAYLISDGAQPAGTFAGTFTTAPPAAARAAWSFTSFGDLATPTAAHNASGTTWNESSDNSLYAVGAIVAESQGAHGPAPLFHLLNGDLCYANLNYNSQPAVWRDFGRNIQPAASAMPWMPCLGNHEIEFGADAQDGTGAGVWNGPYGYGNYQTRFELPDNGVPGYGGNFYHFQVGSVLFLSLDADDVAYQDGGSYYAPDPVSPATTPPSYPDEVTTSGVTITPGQSTYNHQYTGLLAAGPNQSLIPDHGSGRPNRQTVWLQRTLAAARRPPDALRPWETPVDMIVVQMHQCALSSSSAGNGSDLGIRQAWLPLFDRYGVDLVVSGHEHNYERSYAVRGYCPEAVGTVVAPNPGQDAAGSPVFTRQPLPVPGATTTVDGMTAFDTSQGTVFLVLGGGGTDGPTNVYGTDASGDPQAKVITQRNRFYIAATGSYTKNPADSTEPAPWSARRDVPSTASSPGYAYGYARFDVDPGSGPGQTRIVMSYYHAARTGSGTSFVGTTSYSLLEQVVYGRGLSGPPGGTVSPAHPPS